MATKLGGWSGIARQYPVFSRTWFVYRMRSFLVPMVLLTLVLALVGATSSARLQQLRLYVMLAAVWVVVALGLSVGRALAVLVCRRGWTAQREAAGIVCALLSGVLLVLPLTPYTRASPPPNATTLPRLQDAGRESVAGLINLFSWFLILVWLGGGTDLLAYFKQRRMLREAHLLGEMARYRHERNEVEMQLAVLASQVEPHFLFNTLAGVRAAMLSDPARGVVIIDHLVDYLRSTIPQLRSDRAHQFVSLGSQIDAARAYLGIIEARLPRLSTRIDCPAELRGVAMPPLMLISLVENAVKHGIELKKGPGLIEIAAARRTTDLADVLELSVADNGPGFGDGSTGNGIGLVNIRQRLKHLYEGEASLALRMREEGGVVATIVLPIRAMLEGAT
ncbi:histidine kinase [Massilia agilis]|uniref:Histidine kinase n=1 Tax=Massilia agilis TaxID=1811226 RepID=A0ABT2D7S0_9BURK|nr:histidine kinase [Massilia agilis]MCS0806869.1 histidine kinase [Massilia agilis]